MIHDLIEKYSAECSQFGIYYANEIEKIDILTLLQKETDCMWVSNKFPLDYIPGSNKLGTLRIDCGVKPKMSVNQEGRWLPYINDKDIYDAKDILYANIKTPSQEELLDFLK